MERIVADFSMASDKKIVLSAELPEESLVTSS